MRAWPVETWGETQCVKWDDGERSMVFMTRIGPNNTYQITFRDSEGIARNVQCVAVELGALHTLIETMLPETAVFDETLNP